jgi:hypothetical protein
MIQRQTPHIQQLAARVQELEARNALDEAIERAVDRAIARAFARMGEVK